MKAGRFSAAISRSKRRFSNFERSIPSRLAPARFSLADGPVPIQGEIADRGEIVEVGVFLQQRLHLVLGVLEFLVLHLQFDLVDLQFVEQPLRVGFGFELGPIGRGRCSRAAALRRGGAVRRLSGERFGFFCMAW